MLSYTLARTEVPCPLPAPSAGLAPYPAKSEKDTKRGFRSVSGVIRTDAARQGLHAAGGCFHYGETRPGCQAGWGFRIFRIGAGFGERLKGSGQWSVVSGRWSVERRVIREGTRRGAENTFNTTYPRRDTENIFLSTKGHEEDLFWLRRTRENTFCPRRDTENCFTPYMTRRLRSILPWLPKLKRRPTLSPVAFRKLRIWASSFPES